MDRRILLVDDDPAMLKLLSKYLTDAEYQVLTAEDGESALRILHRVPVSVVLSDWSMPGMSGLDLCRAIRASEAIGFVYVVIITAHSDKDRVVEALEAGANDFLAKPFHHQELLARLNAGLRIITLEADLQRQQRELHKANAELAILNNRLERMATMDELTNVGNRREAMARLKAYWAVASANGQPLSCIMIDLDHFKACNDRYGHDMGDEVLRQTAALFQRLVRKNDMVCRTGGEEFLILCPNAGAAVAAQVAERLRAGVEDNEIQVGPTSIRVTISAGVAECSSETDTFGDLLKCADQALYEVKRNGRNRVHTYGEPSLDLACDAGACV